MKSVCVANHDTIIERHICTSVVWSMSIAIIVTHSHGRYRVVQLEIQKPFIASVEQYWPLI